jgi:hypothetical protein
MANPPRDVRVAQRRGELAVSVLVMLVAPRGLAGLLRDRLGWTLFPVAPKRPAGDAAEPPRRDGRSGEKRLRSRSCKISARLPPRRTSSSRSHLPGETYAREAANKWRESELPFCNPTNAVEVLRGAKRMITSSNATCCKRLCG